ncbi:MAG: HPP family protein [Gammaproteobacteria bacterium]
MLYARIKKHLLTQHQDVSHKEVLISVTGAFAGISCVAILSSWSVSDLGLPYLIASLGASSVLLFATPHSPMAQPWPLVGGHVISALIGVTCYKLVPSPILAASFAVAFSILVMYYLRCLHPPGGATSLLAVLGGSDINSLGYFYVITPITLNVVLMLIMVVVLNRYLLKRQYPTTTIQEGGYDSDNHRVLSPTLFSDDDLTQALDDLDTYIDVSSDDLNKIFSLAIFHSRRKSFGDLRCEDIMTRDVISVNPDTRLDEVWSLFRQHNINGAPVIDSNKKIVGQISINDFLFKMDSDVGDPFLQRLSNIFSPKNQYRTSSPEVVSELMSAPVKTMRENDTVKDAIAIGAAEKLHYIPVINNKDQLVGILTCADFIAIVEKAISGISFESSR